MPSNIRAFVQWKEPTVFAGEDIECIITFKNATKSREETEGRAAHKAIQGNTGRRRVERPRATTQTTTRPTFSRARSIGSTKAVSYGRGHRPTLSLNVVPNTSPHTRTASNPSSVPALAVKPTSKHGRSLSIMSLASDAPSAGPSRLPLIRLSKSGRGHGRSASMQVVPRRPPQVSPPIGG